MARSITSADAETVDTCKSPREQKRNVGCAHTTANTRGIMRGRQGGRRALSREHTQHRKNMCFVTAEKGSENPPPAVAPSRQQLPADLLDNEIEMAIRLLIFPTLALYLSHRVYVCVWGGGCWCGSRSCRYGARSAPSLFTTFRTKIHTCTFTWFSSCSFSLTLSPSLASTRVCEDLTADRKSVV